MPSKQTHTYPSIDAVYAANPNFINMIDLEYQVHKHRIILTTNGSYNWESNINYIGITLLRLLGLNDGLLKLMEFNLINEFVYKTISTTNDISSFNFHCRDIYLPELLELLKKHNIDKNSDIMRELYRNNGFPLSSYYETFYIQNLDLNKTLFSRFNLI